MRFHGLQKTTLLDYPGHVAATLFTGGCNFSCPFCHNADLVLNPGAQPEIPMEEIRAFLRKRQGILDGVCITGGEPTLQPDLKEFVREVRELGYLVKLDTNGYRPEVLERLLDEDLLDYVAMDIKASKENYTRAVGFDSDTGVSSIAIEPIERSVELLKGSRIEYEFRTTVVKGIHTVEEFEAIGQWLAGCKAYYLQGFQANGNVLAARLQEAGLASKAGEETFDGVGTANLLYFESFSREEMEQMASLAEKYVEKVLIRGVE